MRNKSFSAALGLALIALVVMLASVGGLPASAAPAAAITPVAVKAPVNGQTSVLLTFFDGEALTADTIRCKDLGDYMVIDMEYIVDQGTTNTTTVTLLHTNQASPSVYATGQVVVSANAADANALNRFDLYGQYTCVQVDVANTNPVTWTVTALARK